MKITTLAALFLFVIFSVFLPVYAHAETENPPFEVFLAQLRSEALEQGISENTLSRAFADLKAPKPRVVHNDRNQPEVKHTLDAYLRNRTDKARIETGRQMLENYPTWLGRVEQKYGIPRKILVSLWGIETNYGKHTGSLPVVQSLTTLIYEGRRSILFKKELFAALQLVDDGVISLEQMRGSWAGALGPFQFMPTSVRGLAVDEDKDGSIDLWTSVPDALGSAAHFLDRAGWVKGQSWGRRVKLPKGFDPAEAGLKNRQPLAYWRNLGVKTAQGRPLPRSEMTASLLLPDGPSGSAYLVYDNFRVLMRWNRSQLFAITVGELANRF